MLIDDVDISNFIMKKLIGLLPFKVDVFDFIDSAFAFNSIKDIEPDLIFLDLNMPVISGWDLLEKMKKNNLHHKVVILTSSTNSLDKEHSKKYPNVIDFCEKPIRKEKLYSYLNMLVTELHLV